MVRSNVKKVAEKAVPFYYVTDPATGRQVFYVAGVPGKGSVFSNLAKINSHLKTKGKGEEEFPKTAKFSAGTAVIKDDVLTLDSEAQKGISGASLLKLVKKINLEMKLNLGLLGLAHPEDDQEDKDSSSVGDQNETLDEPDEPEPEEKPKDSQEKTQESSEESSEQPKVAPPPPPPLPSGPPSGPRPGDIARLRSTIKARVGSLKKGDIGTFAYFSTSADGKPLLVLSKPGVALESAMLKAGTGPVEGDYRCVVPGGVEMVSSPFDTKPFVEELGLRCRFVASLPVDAPPSDLTEWKTARDKVIFDLKTVAAKVKSTGFPKAPEVVNLLRAIGGRLRVDPVTPALVRELESYLRDDDDVAAADEIPKVVGTLSIRKPLLAALEILPH